MTNIQKYLKRNLKPMAERREIKPEENDTEESTSENCFTCKCEDVNAKYSKIAEELYRDCTVFMSGLYPAGMRLKASENIKNRLTELLDDEEIKDLVDIYREHTEDNLIRFEAHNVSKFIYALRERYGNKPFNQMS